jgi:hypothetical protein
VLAGFIGVFAIFLLDEGAFLVDCFEKRIFFWGGGGGG